MESFDIKYMDIFTVEYKDKRIFFRHFSSVQNLSSENKFLQIVKEIYSKKWLLL